MKNSLYILAFAFLVFSCKKTAVDEEVTPQRTSADSLVVIDRSAQYDIRDSSSQTILSDHGNISPHLTIDINKDGINDLSFDLYLSTALAPPYSKYVRISCLNSSTSVLTITKKDTLCSYYYETDQIGGDGIWKTVSVHENYNPSKTYNTTLQFESFTDHHYPTVCSLQDTLYNAKPSWRSDELTLASYYFYAEKVTSDSIYQNSKVYGPWNNIDHRFVAVRFISGDNTYIGWLELGLAYYQKLTLYGYAFKETKK